MIRSQDPLGTLFIVSTPIGNLDDITLRAIEILKNVDLIASEDTRTGGKLLAHYGIKARQTSYHDHNERSKAPRILKALKSGVSVALITEAGTPLISDPGYTLVNLALENGIDVIPIPGPSSILAALVASGFPAGSFCFEGYPPKTAGKLKRFFERMVDEPRTIIFLETPHRINTDLKVMHQIFGDREIFLGRELTKKFEEKLKGKIGEISALLESRKVKGEMVIVVRGSGKK